MARNKLDLRCSWCGDPISNLDHQDDKENPLCWSCDRDAKKYYTVFKNDKK